MFDKLKQLSKDTAIYGISTMVGRFLNFLLVPFYTNIFAPSEYGIIQIFFAYIAIIILTFYVPSKAPLITESLLAPWIIRSYQSIVGLVSPDHYNNWKKKILGKTGKVNSIIFEKEKK